jgi:CheY-like chemotaxis protein
MVSVYVPRLQAAELRREPEQSARGGGPGGGICRAVVLLVDDDPEVRAVAAAMLHEAGHTVIEAGSGDAALERLDEDAGRIDLLIADLAMPGMSGFELARAVREGWRNLPILFITGFADTAAKLDSIDAHRLLMKPFRAAELAAKVAEALGQAEAG